jgi:hypothetical protein
VFSPAIWNDPLNGARPLDDIQLRRFSIARDFLAECFEFDDDLLANLSAAGGCLTDLQRRHIQTVPSGAKVVALLDMVSRKSDADFRRFIACVNASRQQRLVLTLLTEDTGIGHANEV